MPAVNSRDLKRKIRAVGNIKKITRAMQMVSAAKLRKVQERLMTLRPYADKITAFLQDLAGQVKELNYPLFVPRAEVKRVGVVVMMADKGLCGSYNSNVARYADRHLQELGKPVDATAIGRKAVDFFRGRSVEAAAYTQLPTEIPFAQIKTMTSGLVDAFVSGKVDEVHLVFTRYVNAMTFRPGHVKFLPIEPPKAEGPKAAGELTYEFEPEPAAILDRLIPRYVEVSFHRLLLESMSSEHAARMNAMRNATDSASDLISALTLQYNKARQSGITKELSEIVAGAEALK